MQTSCGRVVVKRLNCLCCGALGTEAAFSYAEQFATHIKSSDGLKRPCLRRDVYSGWLKLKGEEHKNTLIGGSTRRFPFLYSASKKPRPMRKTIPLARRVLGESDDTLKMWNFAMALYPRHARRSPRGRETLEDTGRRARAGGHPTTAG